MSRCKHGDVVCKNKPCKYPRDYTIPPFSSSMSDEDREYNEGCLTPENRTIGIAIGALDKSDLPDEYKAQACQIVADCLGNDRAGPIEELNDD